MNTIERVKPGDLIRADYINGLVDVLEDALSQLDALGVQSGNVTVPDLFGATLSQARAALTSPLVQLAVGTVFDVLGNLINPNLLGSNTLTVLFQIPNAGARAFRGSSVNMVVSGGTSAGSTPKLPMITGFMKPDNSAPQPETPIGEDVLIAGQNFDLTPVNNKVFFNDVPAAPPSDASTGLSLIVTVPTGISGAPTTTGQKLTVTVRVVTAAGEASLSHTILAPTGGPARPAITDFNPTPGTTGSQVTILGQNFSAVPADLMVLFDTVSASPVSSDPTHIVVTIPRNIPGLSAANSLKTVNVVVQKRGASDSSAKGLLVQFV